MHRFVSFYQEVTHRRSLRDNISVKDVTLPSVVQEVMRDESEVLAAVRKIRDRDRNAAQLRLQRIKQQLASARAKNG